MTQCPEARRVRRIPITPSPSTCPSATGGSNPRREYAHPALVQDRQPAHEPPEQYRLREAVRRFRKLGPSRAAHRPRPSRSRSSSRFVLAAAPVAVVVAVVVVVAKANAASAVAGIATSVAGAVVVVVTVFSLGPDDDNGAPPRAAPPPPPLPPLANHRPPFRAGRMAPCTRPPIPSPWAPARTSQTSSSPRRRSSPMP